MPDAAKTALGVGVGVGIAFFLAFFGVALVLGVYLKLRKPKEEATKKKAEEATDGEYEMKKHSRSDPPPYTPKEGHKAEAENDDKRGDSPKVEVA